MSLLDCLSGIIDTSLPNKSATARCNQSAATEPEKDALDIKTADELIQNECAPKSEKMLVEASNLLGKQVEKDPTGKGISIDPKKDYIKLKKSGMLPKNAGKGWANLPATELTPEILNHMKLLNMRK